MSVANARPVRQRPVPARPLEQAGFLGIWDSLNPPDSRPARVRMMQNVYPTTVEGLPHCSGWPGFQLAGVQLGAIGARRGQGWFQYSKTDGTEKTITVVGGRVYEWNWATRTHTQILAGTLLLNTTARVFALNFQEQLILTDGVSKPIALELNAGVWSFTSLANACVCYGQPAVRANKLFLINAADPIEIQWSEEADASIGYATSPYNNAWRMGQTEQERFYAIAATETALYLARERSITAVLGDITPEFISSNTQEAVSSSVGTRTPMMLVAEGYVWLLDSDGRPQRFPVGGALQAEHQIWRAAAETTRRVNRALLEDCSIVYWPEIGHVLYGMHTPNALEPDMILGFTVADAEFATVRRNGWQFTDLAVVKGDQLRPTLVHTDPDGYAYDHGFPHGSLWNDVVGGVQIAIPHMVEGAALGYSTHFDKAFLELHCTLHVRSSMTGLSFDYQVPSGWSLTSLLGDLAGGTAVYGTAVYGVSTYTGGSKEERIVIGVSDEGRWSRPRFRHSALNEQFGIEGWTVFYVPLGAIPETK